MQTTRKRCDACQSHVARSWFARHVASGCRLAPGVRPRAPRFWLDGSLRLRPYETLARNADYFGVRTIRPRKSRRWEPV